MAKNKVVYNNQTLIDLTSDTVTPSVLLQGYTAHRADGTLITGTMEGGPTIDIGTDYIQIGTYLRQHGKILQAANSSGSIASKQVTFQKPFKSGTVPNVQLTSVTKTPYTQVRNCSVEGITNTGFTAYWYRTNSTKSDLNWSAEGEV